MKILNVDEDAVTLKDAFSTSQSRLCELITISGAESATVNITTVVKNIWQAEEYRVEERLLAIYKCGEWLGQRRMMQKVRESFGSDANNNRNFK